MVESDASTESTISTLSELSTCDSLSAEPPSIAYCVPAKPISLTEKFDGLSIQELASMAIYHPEEGTLEYLAEMVNECGSETHLRDKILEALDACFHPVTE